MIPGFAVSWHSEGSCCWTLATSGMLTFLRLSQAIQVMVHSFIEPSWNTRAQYENEDNLTFPDAIDLNS